METDGNRLMFGELQRRLAELQTGQVQAIPVAEAITEARARLR